VALKHQKKSKKSKELCSMCDFIILVQMSPSMICVLQVHFSLNVHRIKGKEKQHRILPKHPLQFVYFNQ